MIDEGGSLDEGGARGSARRSGEAKDADTSPASGASDADAGAAALERQDQAQELLTAEMDAARASRGSRDPAVTPPGEDDLDAAAAVANAPDGRMDDDTREDAHAVFPDSAGQDSPAGSGPLELGNRRGPRRRPTYARVEDALAAIVGGRAATPDAEPSQDSDPADSGETMDDAAMFAAIFPDHEKSDAEPSGDEETLPVIPTIAGVPERVRSPAPDAGAEAEPQLRPIPDLDSENGEGKDDLEDDGIQEDDVIPDHDDFEVRSWGAEEAEAPTSARPRPKSSSTAIMTASALFAAAVAVAL